MKFNRFYVIIMILGEQIISSSGFLRKNCTMATDAAESRIKNQNVDYEGLIEAQKDEEILIIDVREQKEIDETGKLPGSIHIPSEYFGSSMVLESDLGSSGGILGFYIKP